VRIVGRPQDLVRADIVGERTDRALDRLERDPAIAPEDVARRIVSPESLKPLSSKWRSMRSSHGAIQPPPDSRNATLSLGCRSQTPPQIMLIAASIISMVCEMMC